MTDYVFQDVLEGFDDPFVGRFYDDTSGKATALEQIQQSLRAHWQEGAGDTPKDPAALYEHATALAGFLEQGLVSLMRDQVPSTEATANTDFLLETSEGLPVTFEEKLEALQKAAPQDVGKDTLRIANLTLEQNFQSLLDHLTAQRIAEEMDTPTYLERMRGGFKRVHDGSALQADKLDQQLARTNHAAGRVNIAAELASFLKIEVAPKLHDYDQENDATTISALADPLLRFAGNATAYLVHLKAFLSNGIHGLRQINQSFCANSNVSAAEGEARLVSAEIERRPIYRPLPLLWALCVTLLVKVVLAQNTSESLHYLAVSILVFSFIATWVFSISIGVWVRNRRMRDLQAHTRRQLQDLIGVKDKNSEFVTFPTVGAQERPTAAKAATAFAFQGKTFSHKKRVFKKNLWALLIPAALFFVVLSTRQDVEHDFIARFENSDSCVLASGHLVFATRSAYFVKPSDKADTWGEWALSNIFPELTANVVDRANIISVRKFASDNTRASLSGSARGGAASGEGMADESLLVRADEGGRLRDCVTADRQRNVHTVTHRGNVLGVLGTADALTSFSSKTDQLIAAIEKKQPIFIEGGGINGIGEGSITVDLGETSLDVLTQAIALGGGSGSNDPTVIDARRVITLELSKPDPTEINFDVVLTSLQQVQAVLGDDVTMAQALSVTFANIPGLQQTLNLSDKFLLLFEGQNGEGGLVAELANLRLALESTNQIASEFSQQINGGDQSTFVTVLNQELTRVLDKQDQLIAVLSAGLSQSAASSIVVTPIITEPATGTEGGGLSQTIFQTTLDIGGNRVEVDTLGNSLVLPFFTAPVSGQGDPIDTPVKAFNWGGDVNKLNDPVVRDNDVTYFRRVADTISGCLQDDSIVEIDIVGLSSRSWDQPVDSASSDDLNYHLAEGRRLAALKKLGAFIPDEDVQNRILIGVAEGRTVPLRQVLANASGVSDAESVASYLQTLGHFESRAAFEVERNKLIAVAGLDADQKSPLEELFARSVVLRMISVEGGPCQF